MATPESNKAKDKKIKLLLDDINTFQMSKVQTALDGLRIHADVQVVKPLFEFILNAKSPEIAELILAFLSDLKVPAAREEVMRCLRSKEFQSVRPQILTSIWNSSLDYSQYLSEFVSIAVQFDFMITLECLTVIENLEGPFEEQAILESQLQLKDYLENKYPKTKEKDALISEIALLIKDFDRNQSDLDHFELN